MIANDLKMTSKMTSKLAIELNVQVSALIQDAPNDPITTQSMVTLAPLLAKFALTMIATLIKDQFGGSARELLTTGTLVLGKMESVIAERIRVL